jgi:hypothetical protein
MPEECIGRRRGRGGDQKVRRGADKEERQERQSKEGARKAGTDKSQTSKEEARGHRAESERELKTERQ